MLWLIIGIGVFVLCLIVWGYNSLARMHNVVRNAWSDIDVQLKRRSDLVPNLVETVRGYSGFEESVLRSVTEARQRADLTGLSPLQRAEVESDLARRIFEITAIVENYPDLKASAQYLRLQNELSGTETNIANARRYYNASVRDFNTMLDSFPLGLVGALAGFKRREFFELESVDEREPPSVS